MGVVIDEDWTHIPCGKDDRFLECTGITLLCYYNIERGGRERERERKRFFYSRMDLNHQCEKSGSKWLQLACLVFAHRNVVCWKYIYHYKNERRCLGGRKGGWKVLGKKKEKKRNNPLHCLLTHFYPTKIKKIMLKTRLERAPRRRGT